MAYPHDLYRDYSRLGGGEWPKTGYSPKSLKVEISPKSKDGTANTVNTIFTDQAAWSYF